MPGDGWDGVVLEHRDGGDHVVVLDGVDDGVAVPEPGQLPPSDRQLPLPDGMDGELLIKLDWNLYFKLLFFLHESILHQSMPALLFQIKILVKKSAT